jgi:hypothetical protein
MSIDPGHAEEEPQYVCMYVCMYIRTYIERGKEKRHERAPEKQTAPNINGKSRLRQSRAEQIRSGSLEGRSLPARRADRFAEMAFWGMCLGKRARHTLFLLSRSASSATILAILLQMQKKTKVKIARSICFYSLFRGGQASATATLDSLLFNPPQMPDTQTPR